ncbi:MAG: ABC transporter substrate-binding protein [Chloroflexi bacterium]|nr:ABC transporter substrate-binding protein [Chloroflexota bacterium]MCL5111058.1 ABC transporter substrate-binding protein [Chloroflexota bacterium]
MSSNISRRGFLRLSAVAGTALLMSCSPAQAPAPTAAPATKAPGTQAPAAPAASAVAATQAPVAASTQAPVAGTPKKGGQIKVGMSGDLANFEPTIQLQPNIPILFNLFDTPTQYDKQMKPQPYLATSWQFASDGLSVTMKIRQGVKFHTGRELTAEDVNFALRRAQDPKVGALYKFMADKIVAAEAPDPYTVVWRFQSANPGVYDLMSKLHVVDKENIDKTDFTKRGSGTGPFIFSEFVPGNRMLLKRNPNYWRKDAAGNALPYLDEVLITMFPDPQAAVANLEAGAIDVLTFVPIVDAVRLRGGSKITVVQGPVRALYDILMTTAKKPFAEQKVRQAVSNLVNREQYWSTNFNGVGDWTCIPFPSQSAAYFADLAKSIKPDVEKAKKLLADAGYADGFETSILTSRQVQKEHLDIAVLYQQDLAKIGIKAKIDDVEAAEYNRRVLAGELETAIHAYARANYDPDTLFGGAKAWTPTVGFTKFGEPEYVKLINDAASSYNMEERKPKYRTLIQYVMDQAFTLTVCYNPELYAYAPYAKGVTTDTDYNTDYSQAWLDK